MANWISITRILQHAYGVAALQVGIPFNCYRLGNPAAINWIDPNNLIASNLRIDRQPVQGGNKGFETTRRMDVLWWELMGDFNAFLVGDVFISSDTVLNAGWVTTTFNTIEFIGFVLAENMPTRAPIGARLHVQAQLYTPRSGPDFHGYFDSTNPQRLPIVLSNGQYMIGDSSQTAAIIPIAFMPHRTGGDIYNQPTANVTNMERRIIYVPPMPGPYLITAGDEFVMADGSRYVIESNFHQASCTTGFMFTAFKNVSGFGQ